MIKATLEQKLRDSLEPHQANFLEEGINRIFYIEERLKSIDDSEMKFLFIKELFVILGELQKIKYTKTYKTSNVDSKLSTADFEKVKIDLNKTIAFFRNVVSHFPLFKTWNEVWISKSMAKSLTSDTDKLKNNYGTIYKYLLDCENRISHSFRVKLYQTEEPTTFNLLYPKKIGDDTQVYFKDIVSENDVLKWIFYLSVYSF
ncbi:hypothetical protein D3C87_105580 [compost metagenome]